MLRAGLVFLAILLAGAVAGTLMMYFTVNPPPSADSLQRLAAALLVCIVALVSVVLVTREEGSEEAPAAADGAGPAAAAPPADESVLDEMIRMAEARLSAQYAAALAADQKSNSFAGWMIAVTLALGGGTLLLLRRGDSALAVAAGFASLMSLAAAALAYWAGKPRPLAPAGIMPSDWTPEMRAQTDLRSLKAELCRLYEARLHDNERTLAEAAHEMAAAMLTGLCVPAVALVVYLVAERFA